MDGENSGKSYEQMDDLGGAHPYSWKCPGGLKSVRYDASLFVFFLRPEVFYVSAVEAQMTI